MIPRVSTLLCIVYKVLSLLYLPPRCWDVRVIHTLFSPVGKLRLRDGID